MAETSSPPSPLEKILLEAPAQNMNNQALEMSVLRDVLLGLCGTPAQRNTLLRIIRANRTSGRAITSRLHSLIDPTGNSMETNGGGYLFADGKGEVSLTESTTDDDEDLDDEDDGN